MIRFSYPVIVFVWTQFIQLTLQYSPCLSTIPHPKLSKDFKFALAAVDLTSPIGPQEACYYSCGAQIVTYSSDTGDMAQLTVMDIGAPLLVSNGFLKSGQAYVVNHVGLPDNKGGNGLGCIYIQKSVIEHYPMSHSICKSAKIAICGYWGQQTLPLASMEMPTLMADPHLIIPNLVDPTEATTTQSMSSNSASLLPHSSQPRVVSSLNSPTSIHGLSSAHTSIESISPSSTSIDSISSTHTSISHTSIHSISSAMPSAVPEPHPPVTDFYLDGNHYSIVHQRPDKHGSAESICRVTHNGYLADVSAGELPTVTEHLINLKIDRIVIGSWNSDGYSLTDNSCLILRKDNGISVGQCSDTTYLLCSDQNTSHFA